MKKVISNKENSTTKETPSVRRVPSQTMVENQQRFMTSFELVPVLTARRLQKLIEQHFQNTVDTG